MARSEVVVDLGALRHNVALLAVDGDDRDAATENVLEEDQAVAGLARRVIAQAGDDAGTAVPPGPLRKPEKSMAGTFVAV